MTFHVGVRMTSNGMAVTASSNSQANACPEHVAHRAAEGLNQAASRLPDGRTSDAAAWSSSLPHLSRRSGSRPDLTLRETRSWSYLPHHVGTGTSYRDTYSRQWGRVG